MKQHDTRQARDIRQASRSLAEALLCLDTPAEMTSFLQDLCTPSELEAMVDRWRVVELLDAGNTYRDIHDKTEVSVTTIGRVARYLADGAGGYRTALERLR
jgi:TrpR-related protein YerC/YecD